VDAESEIITATEVTAGNASDASAAEVLLADVLTSPDDAPKREATNDETKSEVYGDASYGTADLVEQLESAGVEPNVKVQPPSAREGSSRKTTSRSTPRPQKRAAPQACAFRFVC
jgi:hypothetical protein